MNVRIIAIVVSLLHLSTTAIVVAEPAPIADRQIENLRTFSKLYGYVRFFHPTDAAAETDWDRFAIHGVSVVRDAADRQDLAGSLRALFAPIAPTVVIYDSERDEKPAPPPVRDNFSATQVIAWQHSGVGLQAGQTYRSVRTNRASQDSVRDDFGAFTQILDATPYRGREIRLRAAVRTEAGGEGNTGHLWLRVERPGQQTGFFDNMADRPITTAEWTQFEITGPVDEDATSIAFGGYLIGDGRLWADAFDLSTRDETNKWQKLPIYNPSFEDSPDGPINWFIGAPNYAYEIVTANQFDGEYSLMVSAEPPAVPGAIFDFVPPSGTSVDKKLGAGLRALVPIALADHELQPMENSRNNGRLSAELAKISQDDLTAIDPNVRFAGIVIAWNLMQHFYPYFDVIDTDWDTVLTEALRNAMDDVSVEDYVQTLGRLMSRLEDGHGNVFADGQGATVARLPFRMRWIEDRAVVTQSLDPDSVKPGDIVIEIDGRQMKEILDEELQLVSGTLRWKRYRVLAQLGTGPENSDVRLKLDRSGEQIEVIVSRSVNSLAMHELEPIDELGDGIRYIDLRRAEWSDISRSIDELAAAPAVIFDLRGYPNGNHDVLSHLTDDTLQSAIWNKPQIVYPDQEDITGWDQSGRWLMPPRKPRFQGKIAFVTDASAISYAESVMGIVEHYKLGEIVGEATAGANGNANWITLPGNIRIVWTGMKVLKHDGSQHHLIGIQPTIPVPRTIEGVRAGVDELLEGAIQSVRIDRLQ